MSDLISRQAILKHIEKIRQGVQMIDDTHRASIVMNGMYLCEEAVRNQPSVQPEQKEPCSACEGLENGDTLYASSDWDGGIGFDYIRDIKYCPVCGRRLNNG